MPPRRDDSFELPPKDIFSDGDIHGDPEGFSEEMTTQLGLERSNPHQPALEAYDFHEHDTQDLLARALHICPVRRVFHLHFMIYFS